MIVWLVVGEYLVALLLWWLGSQMKHSFGSYTEQMQLGNAKLTEAISLGTAILEEQDIIHSENQQILAELKRLRAS